MKISVFYLLLFLFSLQITAQSPLDFFVSKELTENANAIVKDIKETLEIKSSKKILVEVSKKVIVLNEKGNFVANPYLYYYKDYSIKNLEVVVYNMNGKEIKKIKKGDFKDVAPNDNSNLIADGRLKIADYTPTVYPYLLHFTYSYETSDTAFLPRFIPFENYNVSVENAFFEVKNESKLPLRKLEKNFEGYAIEKQESDSYSSYTLKNLYAQKGEPYGLSYLENFPVVYFALTNFHLKGYDGQATTWKELGEWFYEKLYKTQTELSVETVEKIKKLTQNATSDVEKAKIVYQFVQDKTRYVSIQLGIGGWQPMLAKDVDRLGYGDCKALTNYTHALLKAVGVESYHTIIHSDRTKLSFAEDFPILQGNHMILHIPIDDGIWLECTSQKNMFGYIGMSNEDRNVLLITPDGGKITTTKKYTTEENKLVNKATIQLDSAGSAKASLASEFYGSTIDYRAKIDYLTQKEKEDFYIDNWSYHNGLKITSFKSNKNSELNAWQEQFEFEFEKLATILGSRILLNTNIFTRDISLPDKVRNRKQPVNISRGRTENDETTFSIPSNFTIEVVPEPIIIESKYGSYQATVTVLNNEILYKRSFKLNEGLYPKEEYNNFRDFINEVIKHDNSKIALLNK